MGFGVRSRDRHFAARVEETKNIGYHGNIFSCHHHASTLENSYSKVVAYQYLRMLPEFTNVNYL